MSNLDLISACFRADFQDTSRIFLEDYEDNSEIRDGFQHDRDRILYSKEFRRLSGKTQVFASGFDDNMRTRLTHTLEVAQIANTICQALGLNQTLCEAIALGHDVGHTPFGHVGERTLNMIMNSCLKYYNYEVCDNRDCGFKHNLQGLRVTMELESGYANHSGINLSKYTLWGIANHSKLQYRGCEYYSKSSGQCRYRNANTSCRRNGKFSLGFYDEYLSKLNNETDWTVEAMIVGIADEIAQRHHDIEDGIFGKLIQLDALRIKLRECFPDKSTEIDTIFEQRKQDNTSLLLRNLARFIVSIYVKNYIDHLKKVLCELIENYNISNDRDLISNKRLIFRDYSDRFMQLFGFDETLKNADKALSSYLKDTILLSELAQTMDGKATFVIKRLFKAYLSNPQQLPDSAIKRIIKRCEKNRSDIDASDARVRLSEFLTDNSDKIRVELLRTICDYIAGMTDQYAMQQFNKLYGTNELRNGL